MQDQIKNLNNNFEFFPKINSSFTDKEEVLIPKMMSPEQIDKHYENRKNQEQKFTAIKQKIEKRRNQVYKMNLLGYTNEEIATNLGVRLSTIEKDLHYMKYYTKWTKEITQSGL